jgi:hypothetical protein
MESGYTITSATPEHLEALSDIELAAATMFEGYVPASVPQVSTPQSKFECAQREGTLWVALYGATPVGFALCEMLAEDLHDDFREPFVLRDRDSIRQEPAIQVGTPRRGNIQRTRTK